MMTVIKNGVRIDINDLEDVHDYVVKICHCVECDGSCEVKISMNETEHNFLLSLAQLINEAGQTPYDEPIIEVTCQ